MILSNLTMLLLIWQLLFSQILCQPNAGDCYCVDNTGNNVTARREGCTDFIKAHAVGACFETTGDTQTCPLEQEPYEVKYGPDNIWVTSNHLLQSETSRCGGIGGNCSRIQFVTRDEWNARDPTNQTPIQPALSGVFVHHSAMDRCFTPDACVAEVQEIQDLHMVSNGWDDIGYHFLVGEDGRVYEGRGWDNRGAHARQHNAWTYGICVMGNFVEALPNDNALTALKDIMDCGVHLGKITQGFEIFGHRDGVCTECPGQRLYEEIETWSYFSKRDIPVDC